MQEISVGLGRGKTRANLGIVVVYGVQDKLVLTYDSPGATFCNRPWSEFFERTGIEPAELWLPECVRMLSTYIAARKVCICQAAKNHNAI